MSDTGPGIERSELKTIFDEFAQNSNFIRRDYKGVGLGLAHCKALAKVMNGTITAENSVQGHGLLVTVKIPCVAVPDGATVVDDELSDNVNYDFTGKFILIVDNDLDHLEIRERVLTKLGAQVMAYSDPLKAADHVKVDHPSMVVLDYHMPGMNGGELVQLIRGVERQYSDQPCRIVIVTGDMDGAIKKRLLDLGADVVLSKPTSTNMLAKALIGDA